MVTKGIDMSDQPNELENFDEQDVPAALARETADGPGEPNELENLPDSEDVDYDEETDQ